MVTIFRRRRGAEGEGSFGGCPRHIDRGLVTLSFSNVAGTLFIADGTKGLVADRARSDSSVDLTVFGGFLLQEATRQFASSITAPEHWVRLDKPNGEVTQVQKDSGAGGQTNEVCRLSITCKLRPVCEGPASDRPIRILGPTLTNLIKKFESEHTSVNQATSQGGSVFTNRDHR